MKTSVLKMKHETMNDMAHLVAALYTEVLIHSTIFCDGVGRK